MATETQQKPKDVETGNETRTVNQPDLNRKPSVISANDINRKIKRAERFGVPVHMSEQEKRYSRADRFGTGTGPEVSEEERRKARSERFGVSVVADEEQKKKARVEKFGFDIKVDSIEEEKRKARALRFSHPRATTVHSNGDTDSGSTNVVVDKAIGGS